MTNANKHPFLFGTKAETLERLQPILSQALIPEFHYFSISEWLFAREEILEEISQKFDGERLAVRSSALTEDGSNSSCAGAFLSKLHVDGNNPEEIAQTIEQVIQSMPGNQRDQVLVQSLVSDVAVSGVIMTYDLTHGSPYYCIEFDDESGRTDAVTAGNGVHKSLYVYRHSNEHMIRSPRVLTFLKLARELENICGCPALDIEFGMSKAGQLFLFQVRRIASSHSWHPVTERRVQRQLSHVEDFVRQRSQKRDGILGDRTILAIMPDWNPAEIIGTTPRPLAASLYRTLITKSAWHQARTRMGYRELQEAELMVLINHHPYIDVRYSFNSFLPAGLPERLGEKLINAWLDRLELHPELHDKVEFEVVPTCMDFCFEQDFLERYPKTLDTDEFADFKAALAYTTRQCLMGESLEKAIAESALLENLSIPVIQSNDPYANLSRANYLLDQCLKLGSLQFAIVARHAFIAEALIRSAVRQGALTASRLIEFKRSIRTVTGSMVTEYALVCQGRQDRSTFLATYGHLRPGTYEITSLRYDERSDLFLDEMTQVPSVEAPEFELTDEERSAIDQLLTEADLNGFTADRLITYARAAIAGREHVKFVFTRVLSDALSSIVRWGASHGLSREDLSFLDWNDISKSLVQPIMDDVDRYYLALADSARKSMASAHAFKLGHIIFSPNDIFVATLNRSVPNFVGIGSITAPVIQLDANTPASVNIKDHIVCIENADPGFDWIFTKAPKGLITRFGGANSHMAIRCAELGLPAAIGCGDQIFKRVISYGSVELNCEQKILRQLHAE